MAQLWPQHRALFARGLRQPAQAADAVLVVQQNEVAGRFGKVGRHLHLADEGKPHPASRPGLVELYLRIGRPTFSVPQRIRHRRFRNPVLQRFTAGKLQRLEQGGNFAHQARLNNPSQTFGRYNTILHL